MPGRKKLVGRRRARFIEALRESANVAEAARRTGVGRTCAYAARQADPAFAEAWDAAIDEATDRLEAEARRRALDGVPEPVFYQGKIVGTIRRYSDRLLVVLLRAYRPERYREKTEVEQKGKVVFEIHTGREMPVD